MLRSKAVSYTHLDVYKRQLLRRYGLQATFNLNSGTFGQVDQYSHLKVKHEKVNKEQVRELYQDFEVACHTVTHPDLASVPEEMISYETVSYTHLSEGSPRPYF